MPPTPFTSVNPFPSYSTLYTASQEENSENRPKGSFSQDARPLARVGFGGADAILKAFFSSFERHQFRLPPSTRSRVIPLQIRLPVWKTPKLALTSLSSRVPDPWPVLYCFSQSTFSPLSNGANSVHLLQLVPELPHFPLALPMDYCWFTRLYGPHGIFNVQPTY